MATTANQFFTEASTDPAGAVQARSLPWGLPYHLTPQDVLRLVQDLHRLLFDLNNQLDERGYEPLERLLDAAGFSGLISRATADRLARASTALVLNRYHNGYPDLLPRDTYAGDSVQHGDRGGLEIKASRNEGGWQAHGPREGWFCLVQFEIHLDEAVAGRDREPTRVRGVYIAELAKEDWSWQPARAGRIRSGTATVKPSGAEKLRSGAVWVDPQYAMRHTDLLEGLRVRQFDNATADTAVLAALGATSASLHPSDIARAVAGNIGVSNASRLEARIKRACARLAATGQIHRKRSGSRNLFSL
ncbi:MAG TPA: hypothetical protein VGH79_01190 [Gaiellaceae bacterium]|jgi:hypothetical protein